MNVARLIKTGSSLVSGQGIQVVTQLLLPPLFLRHYGVSGYGQWIALSSAAQYLGTLNFGLHNYASNHATIAYNRGDVDEVNVIQATSFSILLALAGVVALLTLAVFLLPVSSLLHLTISSAAAAATVYLVGLNLLLRLIVGFLQNSFLVVGTLHRGNNWNNALSVVSLAFAAFCVYRNSSFVVIAASQLVATVLFTLILCFDLYLKARVAFPNLRYVRRSRVMDILRPSGYYGMLISATFLVYQLPMVIIQRILGPAPVVVFSITRTIYSMSRQIPNTVSSALAPEITELFGKRDWRGLTTLYTLSERLVFSLVPLVTLSTFLATPSLLAIWVHKPELFNPAVCVFMTLISCSQNVREHKYQFQTSINHHIEMARLVFFSNIAMVLLSIPVIARFGVIGFLTLWFVTESIQLFYTVELNHKLFSSFATLSYTPLIKVASVSIIGLAVAYWIETLIHPKPVFVQLACVAVFALTLLAVEYPLFGLGEVRRSLAARLSRRSHTEELTPAT